MKEEITRAKIVRVEIKNFRSISRLDLGGAELAIGNLGVFTGNNDSGKSNVLRALNLFFNGEVNPGAVFDFDTDFNAYANTANKAQEIIVKCTFQVPETYRETNGDYISWEKRWRREGLVGNDEYECYRASKSRRGKLKLDRIEVSNRSNIYRLLSKISYKYVPAIKDPLFFEYLRREIYKTISSVADEVFRTSSREFEKTVTGFMETLVSDIDRFINLPTKMAFPRDLSHIFERLDFLSRDDAEISINNRGDGIKARHIPLILRFIANKHREIISRANTPTTFIWGYEEPENNIELSGAIKLAEDFWTVSEFEFVQVFMTTHSPAFYNLKERRSVDGNKPNFFYVKQAQPGRTEIVESGVDVDEEMGFLSILAPYVKEVQEKLKYEEELRVRAERQIKNIYKKRIYVEGESDRIVIDALIKEYFPLVGDDVEIVTKIESAGHSYVIDMLRMTHISRVHDKNIPNCAGLVDQDAAGEAKDWNKNIGNGGCKCFVYKPPKYMEAMKSRGMKCNAHLESYYPVKVYYKAKASGDAESIKFTDLLGKDDLEKLIVGSAKVDDFVPFTIRARLQIAQNKVKYAKEVVKIDSLYRMDSKLKESICEVLQYLKLL